MIAIFIESKNFSAGSSGKCCALLQLLVEANEMLQSIISLEESDIYAVLNAVTAYCAGQCVPVESYQGRKAVYVAIDLVNNRRAADVLSEIRARLDRNPS